MYSCNLATSLLFFIAIITITSSIHEIEAEDIIFPPPCEVRECPTYDVIENRKGFQIRRYNPTEWMSTLPINRTCVVNAADIGVLQILNYTFGQNDNNQKLDFTSPIIAQVSPSDDPVPLFSSAVIASFYIPKKYQENPPPAKNFHVQKWGVKYAAVGQFGGYIYDDLVAQQVDKLYSNLLGSTWAKYVLDKSYYTYAGYNSPTENTSRINEIWFMFDLEGSSNDM